MDINSYIENLLADYNVKLESLGGYEIYPTVVYTVENREPGFYADNEMLSEKYTVKLCVWAETAEEAWLTAEEIRDIFSDNCWFMESISQTGFSNAFGVELIVSNEIYII